jgi:hypothetical protein
MALRALAKYGTPGRAAETKARMARARQWLLEAKPVILEDLNMRLLGVAAARGTFADLRKLAAPVLARQRAYGGWAQRDVFASDAYATGMTLWALAETGVLQPNDEAFRKGASFLLGTQAADGSWHVTAPPSSNNISKAASPMAMINGFRPWRPVGPPARWHWWDRRLRLSSAVSRLARPLDQDSVHRSAVSVSTPLPACI